MSVEVTLANEIRVRRQGEWLCRGLPFPQGTLTDVGGLCLWDEAGGGVPLASEVLACWPDGSVKWALLQFPVHFEGYGRKTYTLDWTGRKSGQGSGIALSRSGDRWEVDNGLLCFTLPLSGQAFLEACRRGDEAYVRSVRAEIVDGEGVTFVSELEGEPEIEHFTEKMLVVSRRGVHRDGNGRKLFSLVFRVTVFADADEVEVEYQFIHDEPYRDVPIRRKQAQGIGAPSVDAESPRAQTLQAVRLVVAHAIGGVREFCDLSVRDGGKRRSGDVTASAPGVAHGCSADGPLRCDDRCRRVRR